MDKKSLLKLIENLTELGWCFMAGFAVEIYTKGKRKAVEDVDLLVSPKDINTFAKRLSCQVQKRRFKKFNFFVNDQGFTTTFNGLRVEVSNGFPKRRINNGTIYKIFQKRVAKKYLGIKLFVEPIEELIIHKASMFRDKDIKDLKLLTDQKVDPDFLKELIKDWGKYYQKKILKNLKKLGYKNL